jgi:predicted nuclease of restriction endonuclease-like RecB superfamily
MRGAEVRPQYIQADDPENLALAAALLQIFESGVGQPRHELTSELEQLSGTGTGFMFHRGLAKLLLDRCEFETEAGVEPGELRKAVFEQAAAAHRQETPPFSRAAVIERVRQSLGIEPEQMERSLYADLKEEQILREFKRCSPEWLLHRYNVALAQAVVFRATKLEIWVSREPTARYREIFRKIKFFQLLHHVEGTAAEGYYIRLDGPLSLFKSSQRYGLQMANFLPTLLHCENWRLRAELLWGKQRWEKTFQLSPAAGLRPYAHLSGQWQPGEMAWLLEEFPKLESDWDISSQAELIDLGGKGVLVPDYAFRHRPTGRRVFMEVFGFWRRGAVASRLNLLREHGPENLILALSKELHVGEEDMADLPGEVYVFRSVPIAREVLGLLTRWEGGADTRSPG